MSAEEENAEPEDHGARDPSRWNSNEIMRQRAQATRAVRDDAIKELRESMTDEEALEEFGIDLREIEK